MSECVCVSGQLQHMCCSKTGVEVSDLSPACLCGSGKTAQVFMRQVKVKVYTHTHTQICVFPCLSLSLSLWGEK